MFRALALGVGLLGFLALYVLLQFYPAFPKSVAGWFAMFFVGAPFLFALEWAGELIFGSRALDRRSSGARVALGVLLVLVMIAVAFPAVIFVSKLINSLRSAGLASNNALERERGRQIRKGLRDVEVLDKVASISGKDAALRSRRTLEADLDMGRRWG